MGDSEQPDMFRTVLDAIPSLIFVVDDDVRIHEYNAAAAEFLSGTRETILKRRGGEVFKCLHSKDVPEGCGFGKICKECAIRNSVAEALQGNHVVRRRARIEIVRDGNTLEIYALITASPFCFNDMPLVLLVIEDISEIAELQRMIPICSICKEIRDEKEAWIRLDIYFKENWDVDFSHSLCPKCYKAEIDKLDRDKEAESGASSDS